MSVIVARMVRGIVDSAEARTDVIDAIYITYLHRPSDAQSLSSFFNSSLDLSNIREAIMASDEFFMNG